MSRKHRDKGRLPNFIPATIAVRRMPAWRALSMGARELYMALKGRFSRLNNNNGRLFLSERTAAKELGSHRNEIRRWYRELQHFGFIVKTAGGCLGVGGRGKAPHWRITELETPNGTAPTNDFEKWDGTPFNHRRGRGRKPKKQNPGRENRSTLDVKTGPLVDVKTGPPRPHSGLENRSISEAGGGRENRSISRLTRGRGGGALVKEVVAQQELPLSDASSDAEAPRQDVCEVCGRPGAGIAYFKTGMTRVIWLHAACDPGRDTSPSEERQEWSISQWLWRE